LIGVLLIAGCERPERVQIEGNFEGGAGKKIYLDEILVGEDATRDSVDINKRDNFRFTLTISEPRFLRLRLASDNYLTLLARPGENIEIKAQSSNLAKTYEIEGSAGSKKVREANLRLLRTKREIDSLVNSLDKIEDETALATAEEEADRQIDSILNEQRRFSVSFVLENIDSPASITVLYQELYDDYVLNRLGDLQYMKIVAEELEETYPDLDYVKSLSADVSRQLEQYELQKLSARAEGEGVIIDSYPDISLPGIYGDTISLRSIEEKYILVTFGSSRNEESTAFHLDMIPVYNAYHHRGFEIYHISMEEDPQEWASYVRFNEYPWLNVAEFNIEDSRYTRIYNVQQIPSNFYINRDIGVIARDLSPSEIRRRLSVAFD